MAFAAGTVISGRFRLLRAFADGGMGTVWLARHTGLDIDCAVKFLLPEMASDAGLVARFEREAKAAAQLKSPNVVQILDYGIFEGTPYIAMEYLEGEDLAQRLARVGRLSPKDTVTILAQVAHALMKAHSVGIIHRDLKPENIFLVKDVDQEIAKVLDFGIAKDKGSSLALTRYGMLLGTPVYMSPEQIQGRTDLDHRADLWSLAVVAFECLTGKPPVQRRSPVEIAAEIVLGRLPLPCSVAGDLPPAVDVFWRRATALDPKSRYSNARELCQALSVSLELELPSSAIRVSQLEFVEAPTLAPPAEAARENLETRQTLLAHDTASLTQTAWSDPATHRGPRAWKFAVGATGGVAVLLGAFLVARPHTPRRDLAAVAATSAAAPPPASSTGTAVEITMPSAAPAPVPDPSAVPVASADAALAAPSASPSTASTARAPVPRASAGTGGPTFRAPSKGKSVLHRPWPRK